MPRNACVIQITPVRLTRTSANDASVVRKIYLSIDPIVTARSHLSAPEPRLSTNPLKNRDPLWSRRQPSSRLLSHYHPFDPSTKWPGRGTLRIWLINQRMLPCGNGGAWQRGGGQVIVFANQRSRSPWIVIAENNPSTRLASAKYPWEPVP